MAADFTRDFSAGFSLASERLNRNLREQELRSIEASRKLQERQIVQRMQLEMEQANLAIEARAETQKALMRAGVESAPFLNIPTPNGTMQVPNPMAKSPMLAITQNLVPVAAKYGGPEAAMSVMKDAFAMQQRGGVSPQIQTLTDPSTGRKVTMAQVGPNSWSIIQPEKENVPLSPFGKLQSDLRSAIQRGDTESAQQLRAKIDSEASSKGMSIRTNPDGTVEILQGGAQGEKLPSSAVGEAEKVANSASSFINTGKELIALAKAPNVGVIGNIKRISTRIVGQIAGEDMIQAGEEFDFAQAATFFRGAATRILKSDSQITEDERKSIIAALPSGGWLEAPTTVKRQAESAIRKVAESARRQINRAGVKMPTELMTPDEIAKGYNDGTLKISEEDAVRMMMNNIFDQ